MSTNDTSYGVAATSERELTIDKLDDVSGAIDTFSTPFFGLPR